MRKIGQSPRSRIVCIRFTPEEYAEIEACSDGLSVGEFTRHIALLKAQRKKHRLPAKYAPSLDRKAFAQILALLGSSDLSERLSQISIAGHSGELSLTPEQDQIVRDACRKIDLIAEYLALRTGVKWMKEPNDNKG